MKSCLFSTRYYIVFFPWPVCFRAKKNRWRTTLSITRRDRFKRLRLFRVRAAVVYPRRSLYYLLNFIKTNKWRYAIVLYVLRSGTWESGCTARPERRPRISRGSPNGCGRTTPSAGVSRSRTCRTGRRTRATISSRSASFRAKIRARPAGRTRVSPPSNSRRGRLSARAL